MYHWHRMTGTAFVTCGTGHAKGPLSAFDAAELDANIIAANAVKASSFVPPHWRIVNDKAPLKALTGKGIFLPMAYACAVSNSARVAASAVIGVNADEAEASVIMEHGDVNITAAQARAHSAGDVEQACAARGWAINRLEEVAVEGAPHDGLYVCALVAVVFVPADAPMGRARGRHESVTI